MSRSTRPFTLLVRPIIRQYPLARARHSILQQNGQVSVQPVRFQKPPLRYERVLRFATKFALTGSLFYLVSDYVVDSEEEEEDRPGPETSTPSIAVVSQALPDGVEGTQVAEAEQAQELVVTLPDKIPEDAVFIPLWWGKRIPSPPYKESDPEWQSYLKFIGDDKRRRSAEISIIRRTFEAMSLSPQLMKILGPPLKVGTVVPFDYDFPSSPPAEYDRLGIEIAEDYVALSSRPQSLEQYKRHKNVIWPESVVKAFISSIKVYGRLQVARLKGYLDVPNKSEEGKMSQIFPDSLDLHEAAASATKATAAKKQSPQIDGNLDKLSGSKSARSNATEQNKSTDIDVTGSFSGKPQADKVASDTNKMLSFLPSLKKSEGDFGAAVTTFKKTLAQSWNDRPYLEPGSILISGSVEVCGVKSRVRSDVIATYNLGTNKLSLHHVVPKRVTPNRLSPRG